MAANHPSGPAAPQPATPKLYCPAGLAARTPRRTVALIAGLVMVALAAIAFASPWGPRGALVAFVVVWAGWMAVMPVVVIRGALRAKNPC